jgi:hypothetical protein
MKIKLEPRPDSVRSSDGVIVCKPVTESVPFCISVNAGILMHRVRFAHDIHVHGRFRNRSVRLWCGNQLSRVTFIEKPDGSRLLCERCESIARANGELTADAMAGCHVHTGRIVARRTCCSRERN